MRIAIAIFGFASLAAALFMSPAAKLGEPSVSPGPVPADAEARPLTQGRVEELVDSFYAKGDRLTATRRAGEPEPVMVDAVRADAVPADAVLAAELPGKADFSAEPEQEGPPLPPPDISAETLCHTLASVAQAHGIPTGFFARLIWQESRFNQRVVSPAGAQGVAQFMPAVAAERGLRNPFDPLSALPHSARFLKEHIQYFGNLGLAAAAYNAGARRVTDWLARRGKLPDETRQYVKHITGHEPERWTEISELDLSVALPRRNPCEGVADLSRDAGPAKVTVQLEPPVQRIIEEARIAAAKAAEAKAKKLAALKAKRDKLLAKLHGGKDKAKNKGEAKDTAKDTEKEKVVAEKPAGKPEDKPGKPHAGQIADTQTTNKRTASKQAALQQAPVKQATVKQATVKQATVKPAVDKPAAKLPPKIADRVTDKPTDKPKARVRVAETTKR